MATKIKDWYRSRTLWVNFLSLFALVLQSQFGYVFSPELQGAILIIANALLRFDTNTGIE